MSSAPKIGVAEPADVATAFAAHWNRHDMASLSHLFVEDAQMVNVVGMWWKSRKEIEDVHAKLHAGPFRDSRLEMGESTVRFLAENVATVHTPWRLIGQYRPDGTPDGDRSGIILFVVARSSLGWRVHACQNTDIVPGVAVPLARST